MSNIIPELKQLMADKEAPVRNRDLLLCFLDFMDISNQVVGDAIACMLMIEAVLAFLKLDIHQWS